MFYADFLLASDNTVTPSTPVRVPGIQVSPGIHKYLQLHRQVTDECTYILSISENQFQQVKKNQPHIL